MWEGLASLPRIRLFGPSPEFHRTPTLSFVLQGHPSANVARRLAEQGLFASHGNFYARTLVERLGQADAGIVRAGCACYTTADEIERLVHTLQAFIQGD
jgi:selenocysteine lyase/cysteine desulfurase